MLMTDTPLNIGPSEQIFLNIGPSEHRAATI